jgi:pentatricopeptide repeat protein
MYAARLQPARDDVKMYTVLLSALGKQWKQHTALAVFERMRTAGMRPNTITFNAVIGVCGKDGRWEKALELLEQMQTDGLAPDLVTFNSLIAACGVGEQWELAADMVMCFLFSFVFLVRVQREPAGSPGPIRITRGTNHLDPWNI